MEFRDLKRQYSLLKQGIDSAIEKVIESGKFISGPVVTELEGQLASYVGRKHCITCGNGTDAIELALRALNVGQGHAVFVPDFTFFSSGEVVSTVGAMPIFVDVDRETYNILPDMLEISIKHVLLEGKYLPKAIIAVDLFGQPAEYDKIIKIARKYDLYLVEDGAQGFGGTINGKKACSFGDISTTSFFPAKPLGCYGDGGAVFTDNDEWNAQIRSLCVHGKSSKGKYDNIQIGMNSRLDSIQAAVLLEKLKAFKNDELAMVNEIAENYSRKLKGVVGLPSVRAGYQSSWAQYTIRLKSEEERNEIKKELLKLEIPSMVYYAKPLHKQIAFSDGKCICIESTNSVGLSKTVLSLPMFPYMSREECENVSDNVLRILRKYRRGI